MKYLVFLGCLSDAIIGFDKDPADSDYQRGYLAALTDARAFLVQHAAPTPEKKEA